MRIIPYERRYRDDLIFMVLEAKDALGRIPTLNEDLLDIQHCYIDRGDAFFVAVDEQDRVIGCIGFNAVEGTNEVFLHRLYVKVAMKRQGIGARLLLEAETCIREKGKTRIRVHLGEKSSYSESYQFYPKHGYVEYAPRYMMKELSP